jgi:hypothetical protein
LEHYLRGVGVDLSVDAELFDARAIELGAAS